MAKKIQTASKVLVYISCTKCNNLSAGRNGLYYINISVDRLKIGTSEHFLQIYLNNDL